MPPLQPVQATARIVVQGIYSTSGGPWINVFHAQRIPTGSALSQSEVNAIASGVRAAWVTNFLPYQSTTVTLQTVTATDLTNSFGLVGSATGSNPGTNATSALPPSVAAGISWVQAQHYRGGHPRTYVTGLTTGHLAGSGSNLLSTTAATDLAAIASAFRTALEAITVDGALNMVLVRRIQSTAVLVPPTVTRITGQSVDRRVDTQRRRLGKDIA